MTSYSILPSGSRAVLIATWPGEWADHSAKVTTLASPPHATELANLLTRLSEDAWDAAAWLDTYPSIEASITNLVAQLRSPQDKIDELHIPSEGFRHTDQWSFTDTRDLLLSDLPRALSELPRAQRLTIADELTTDAAGRADALRVLRTGEDPAPTARGWQTCDITRSLRNGQVGPLPEGAAGWLVRGWGPDCSPAERWAAGDKLARIEQLVAACKAHGGRASAEIDPVLAHLVVPHGDLMEDDEIFYVTVHKGSRNSWDTSPFEAMTIKGTSSNGTVEVLGSLDPGDDDGFADMIGDWTRLVPYRR